MVLDRLQANIAMYAFPSAFVDLLYFTGPAKSMPITSKTAPEFVLSFGRRPGKGEVIAQTRNRLHPQHVLRTFFTNALSRGIQYCSLTAAIVSPTPPWRVSQCTLCINFFVKGALCGSYIGWLPWMQKFFLGSLWLGAL